MKPKLFYWEQCSEYRVFAENEKQRDELLRIPGAILKRRVLARNYGWWGSYSGLDSYNTGSGYKKTKRNLFNAKDTPS